MDSNDTRKHHRINWRIYFWLIFFGWTLTLTLSYVANQTQYHAEIKEMARIQTRSAIDRDILFRQWNSMVGGVYVKITATQLPNKYLTIPERDVTTRSGVDLTLINPSYMTRQIHELGSRTLGLRGHITSLSPLRPQNSPDEWERVGLEMFHNKAKEFSGIHEIDGKTYMRLIKPLIVTKGCLRCHADQGYKIGDIIGGLSVSVPMAPFYTIQNFHLKHVLIWHCSVWFIAILIMSYWAHRLSDQIKKRQYAQEELRQQAMHDVLTGLPNRRLFFDRLNQALKRSRRDKNSVALLYVDLDGFKQVNDSFGHDVGDGLLKKVSETLMTCIREGDTLARLGGDEFCAILSHIETDDDATVVAVRIVNALKKDFNIENRSCRIGASIGISITPTDGETSAELLKNADSAMYAVKKQGKDGFLRYYVGC